MKKKSKLVKAWAKIPRKVKHFLFGLLCVVIYAVLRRLGINITEQIATPLAYLLLGLLVKYSKKVFDVKLDSMVNDLTAEKVHDVILGAEEDAYNAVKKMKEKKPTGEIKSQSAALKLTEIMPGLTYEEALKLVRQYFPRFRPETQARWEK